MKLYSFLTYLFYLSFFLFPFSCHDIKHVNVSNKMLQNGSPEQNIELKRLRSSANEILIFFENNLLGLGNFFDIEESIIKSFRSDIRIIKELISSINLMIEKSDEIDSVNITKLESEIGGYGNMMRHFLSLSFWEDKFFDVFKLHKFFLSRGAESSFFEDTIFSISTSYTTNISESKKLQSIVSTYDSKFSIANRTEFLSLETIIKSISVELNLAIKSIRANMDDPLNSSGVLEEDSSSYSEGLLRNQQEESSQNEPSIEDPISRFNDRFSTAAFAWYEYLKIKKVIFNEVNIPKRAINNLISYIEGLGEGNARLSEIQKELEQSRSQIELLNSPLFFDKFQDYIDAIEDARKNKPKIFVSPSPGSSPESSPSRGKLQSGSNDFLESPIEERSGLRISTSLSALPQTRSYGFLSPIVGPRKSRSFSHDDASTNRANDKSSKLKRSYSSFL